MDWLSTQELPSTPDRDEAGDMQVLSFVYSASSETTGPSSRAGARGLLATS